VLRNGGNITADKFGEFPYGTFTAIQPVDDDKSGLVCECLQDPRLLFENAPILHGDKYIAIWPNRQQSPFVNTGVLIVVTAPSCCAN
jgi:hypothetical protein